MLLMATVCTKESTGLLVKTFDLAIGLRVVAGAQTDINAYLVMEDPPNIPGWTQYLPEGHMYKTHE